MIEKKINLEEIITNLQNGVLIKSSQSLTIDFKISMLEFGKQLLELAAKNAKINLLIDEENDIVEEATINKNSILNTINQIE